MPLNPQSSLVRLFNAPVRSGALIWIGVRPVRRLAMCPVDEAVLDPHVGLEGDHYSRDSGRRQITVIQSFDSGGVYRVIGRSLLLFALHARRATKRIFKRLEEALTDKVESLVLSQVISGL